MSDRGVPFSDDEAFALRLDAEDPLSAFRMRFSLPPGADGRPLVYFNGNSLGLMPLAARAQVEQEMEDWARLGVEGHFRGRTPWYTSHEVLRAPLARLVGAEPREVVAMNSLTVNLHLMMASFFRPSRERRKILMEDAAFPSDTYAAASQLRFHGIDPSEGLVVVRPREGEATLRTEDFLEILHRDGAEIALVLLSGVHYFTGQRFELDEISRAARRHGCVVGLDLAHAVGNVPLRLHDWGVDFAVWCSYKYLNAGPGAVGGCFVHDRHGRSPDLPRLAGWWGNDPATRFRMHLEPEFTPVEGADGWQVSNPPILAMAPLRASLSIFDAAGIHRLREKSVRMTAYLEWLIGRGGSSSTRILTPEDPDARGCQLSLEIPGRAKDRFRSLEEAGVVADFRQPDVIRVAPAPLYNSFHEVWRVGRLLSGAAP